MDFDIFRISGKKQLEGILVFSGYPATNN